MQVVQTFESKVRNLAEGCPEEFSNFINFPEPAAKQVGIKQHSG